MQFGEMFGHEFIGTLSKGEEEDFNKIFAPFLNEEIACFSGEDALNDYDEFGRFLTMLADELLRYDTVPTNKGQYFIGNKGFFKGIEVIIFNVGHIFTTGIDEVFTKLEDAPKLIQATGCNMSFFGGN